MNNNIVNMIGGPDSWTIASKMTQTFSSYVKHIDITPNRICNPKSMKFKSVEEDWTQMINFIYVISYAWISNPSITPP